MMNKQTAIEKKLYTAEEIKKINQGYRGKPGNFDPSKIGKKRDYASKPNKNRIKRSRSTNRN